jgi:hypothetical protein
MKPCDNKTNLWMQILSGLGDDCSSALSGANAYLIAATREMRRQPPAHLTTHDKIATFAPFSASVKICVLDRTERVATISWQDPTSCHYADQRWHRSTAQHGGVCAVTGAAIARGADIFRPSRASPAPANAQAMILTGALPEPHTTDVA